MSKSLIQDLKTADFTYDLPDDKIAKYPLPIRNQSKLLVYENGKITDDYFYNIVNYLPENSNLLLNNTKVIAARLLFRKETGALIELFCLEPFADTPIQSALNQNQQTTWKCYIKNRLKWKDEFLTFTTNDFTLKASNKGQNEDFIIIQFEWNNPAFTFFDIIEKIGATPIPPYFKRESESSDKENYQTIFSKVNGSVAAPTASLHFTKDEFSQFTSKNISTNELTLHVGAGTFKPIKTDTVIDHSMHAEWIEISTKFLMQQLQNCDSINTAVGTTALRSMESLYFLALQISENNPALFIPQFSPYENTKTVLSRKDVYSTILAYLEKNNLASIAFKSQLMILPSYHFKMVDNLITNFHQPNSTLLLLVAAAVGKDWKKIYQHALDNNYRFLSYGDSSFLKINQ